MSYMEDYPEIERHFKAAWKSARHDTDVPAYGLAIHELEQDLKALFKKKKQALLNDLLKEAREYSITDAEMTAHQTGYDGLLVVPVETIKKYMEKL